MFSQAQLEAIAGALGDTDGGFSGSEIAHLLQICGIEDTDPTMTKRKRLLNAFANCYNKTNNCEKILNFIKFAMEPSRHLKKQERYEPLRQDLNRALSFAGLVVDETGALMETEKAQTLGDAEARARELRAGLETRGVHEDVLKCCRAELLADDYFHAALEVSKSIVNKLHERMGVVCDEAAAVDRALRPTGNKPPMLAINNWKTDSEKSEQKGFWNLVNGVLSMFRNPTAHDLRIQSVINKADVEDLLSLASLIHRRLDAAKNAAARLS